MVKYTKKNVNLRATTYDADILEKASRQVRAGKLTKVKAAEVYKVSRSTLTRYMKNGKVAKHGRPTVLPYKTERRLADMLIARADQGIALTRKSVLSLLVELLYESGLESPKFCFSMVPRTRTRSHTGTRVVKYAHRDATHSEFEIMT